jgi:amino acid transporter
MKKTIFKNGLIAGAIVALFMIISTYLWKTDPDFKPTAVYGFTGMLIAFAFIFVGIKKYRDDENNGAISFGHAFKIGSLIALIASTCYVLAWLILYYNFIPDFMDLYSKCVVDDAKAAGETAQQIDAKLAEVNTMKEWYKNPIYVILLTFMEILPLGIVVATICSLILMRKRKPNTTEENQNVKIHPKKNPS